MRVLFEYIPLWTLGLLQTLSCSNIVLLLSCEWKEDLPCVINMHVLWLCWSSEIKLETFHVVISLNRHVYIRGLCEMFQCVMWGLFCVGVWIYYPIHPGMDRGGVYSYPGRSRSPVSNKKVTWREPVDQTQHGQQAAVRISPCFTTNFDLVCKHESFRNFH